MIEEILEYNRKFVEEKAYEPYVTSKYPDKKIAILTCMDTRLTNLLPAALGLKNGDVKMIKNAGGVITHPYGSVVRSLLVGILELGVEEVMVIGHTDCGVQGMDPKVLLQDLEERGVEKKHMILSVTAELIWKAGLPDSTVWSSRWKIRYLHCIIIH